jgi:hypothetical protein
MRRIGDMHHDEHIYNVQGSLMLSMALYLLFCMQESLLVAVFSKSTAPSLWEKSSTFRAVDPFQVLPPSIIVHSLAPLRGYPPSRLAGTPIVFPRPDLASGQDTHAPPSPTFEPLPGTGGIALLHL